MIRYSKRFKRVQFDEIRKTMHDIIEKFSRDLEKEPKDLNKTECLTDQSWLKKEQVNVKTGLLKCPSFANIQNLGFSDREKCYSNNS